MKQDPRSKGFLHNSVLFLIGGVSGAFATLVIQPLDTLKVNIQVASEKLGLEGKAKMLSIGKVFKSIIGQKDGFKILYRGLDSAIFRQLAYASARIGFYNYFVSMYERKGKTPTNMEKVGMSMASGALGALVGNPFDVALIRRQASITQNKVPYRSTFHAFSSIVKTEGPLALWTGLNITILRVVLINIGQMASNDIIKQHLKPLFTNHQSLLANTSAVLASIVTSVISLPADNIKVKIQKSHKNQQIYKGIFDCLRQTVQREGVLKLWVGFPVYLIRGLPHSFILIRTQSYLTHLYKQKLLNVN